MHDHLEGNSSVGLCLAEADTAITHTLKGNLASQDTKSKPTRGKKTKPDEPSILERVSPSGRMTFRVQIRG